MNADAHPLLDSFRSCPRPSDIVVVVQVLACGLACLTQLLTDGYCTIPLTEEKRTPHDVGLIHTVLPPCNFCSMIAGYDRHEMLCNAALWYVDWGWSVLTAGVVILRVCERGGLIIWL